MNTKGSLQMSTINKKFLPFGTGLLGSFSMAVLYFGIVSAVESPDHALDFFVQDLWIVIPIILGFGVQVALYTILKLRLFISPQLASNPALSQSNQVASSGLGASGATSTMAMVACCAHHVTDILPILGLTAATAFLAQYRLWFMWIGLGMTLIGIVYMLFVLFREKRMFAHFVSPVLMTKETL